MQQEQISCPGLPLAVYREVAAHLRQVLGVEAELIPQTATTFDYNQSQVGALLLRYGGEESDRARIEAILDYYARHHGPWQREFVC